MGRSLFFPDGLLINGVQWPYFAGNAGIKFVSAQNHFTRPAWEMNPLGSNPLNLILGACGPNGDSFPRFHRVLNLIPKILESTTCCIKKISSQIQNCKHVALRNKVLNSKHDAFLV